MLEVKDKAQEFFQKSIDEKVKPMTYMNLVFGIEPEPYSEADFYKILALTALNKTEEKEQLLQKFEMYVNQLEEDSTGFYLRGLVHKLNGRNDKADFSFQNCQKKQADHLESLVAAQIPEYFTHEKE